jgi:hypothetical protein
MRSILTGRSVSEWLNTVLGFVSPSFLKVSTLDVLEKYAQFLSGDSQSKVHCKKGNNLTVLAQGEFA